MAPFWKLMEMLLDGATRGPSPPPLLGEPFFAHRQHHTMHRG